MKRLRAYYSLLLSLIVFGKMLAAPVGSKPIQPPNFKLKNEYSGPIYFFVGPKEAEDMLSNVLVSPLASNEEYSTYIDSKKFPIYIIFAAVAPKVNDNLFTYKLDPKSTEDIFVSIKIFQNKMGIWPQIKKGIFGSSNLPNNINTAQVKTLNPVRYRSGEKYKASLASLEESRKKQMEEEKAKKNEEERKRIEAQREVEEKRKAEEQTKQKGFKEQIEAAREKVTSAGIDNILAEIFGAGFTKDLDPKIMFSIKEPLNKDSIQLLKNKHRERIKKIEDWQFKNSIGASDEEEAKLTNDANRAIAFIDDRARSVARDIESRVILPTAYNILGVKEQDLSDPYKVLGLDKSSNPSFSELLTAKTDKLYKIFNYGQSAEASEAFKILNMSFNELNIKLIDAMKFNPYKTLNIPFDANSDIRIEQILGLKPNEISAGNIQTHFNLRIQQLNSINLDAKQKSILKGLFGAAHLYLNQKLKEQSK